LPNRREDKDRKAVFGEEMQKLCGS